MARRAGAPVVARLLAAAFVLVATGAALADDSASIDNTVLDRASFDEAVSDDGAQRRAVSASEPVEVSISTSGAYEASIAADGDDLAVAWYDTRDRYPQIFARFLDGDRASSQELQLTSGKRIAYEPSLQLAEGKVIVAWYDRPSGDKRWTARLAAWDRVGTMQTAPSPSWQVRLSSPRGSGRNPVIRISDGKVFCAWLEGNEGRSPSLWVAWYDLNGKVLVPARRVARASRTTWNLNAAMDGDGRAWVVFDAYVDTKRSELYVVRVDATTAQIERVSRDDGFHSTYPDIAIRGSNVALTWSDARDGNTEVYLIAGNGDELLNTLASGDVQARARRVTQTNGNSIGAYVTWNGTTGGLAWCDDSSGQHEVFFESFDDRGAPLAPARQVSHSPPGSLIPSITAWRGGFALAWNEYQPASKREPKSPARSSVVMTTIP